MIEFSPLFPALPDTLLAIWFVKIIALNMEHFGALAVSALPKLWGEKTNCCSPKNIHRFKSSQETPKFQYFVFFTLPVFFFTCIVRNPSPLKAQLYATQHYNRSDP